MPKRDAMKGYLIVLWCRLTLRHRGNILWSDGICWMCDHCGDVVR